MTSDELRTSILSLGVCGRTVVVAPHPDDEVFAVGGTMALLSAAGCELEVVAVTDGEASHARSERITPEGLRRLRNEETNRAYRELGILPCRTRLALPDSDVGSYGANLHQALLSHLRGADLVLAPIPTDGHPDHEISGAVAAAAAAKLDIRCWGFAVWARLAPERIAGPPEIEISLPDATLECKSRAVRQYVSQLEAIGPGPEDGPVLPPDFLQHFTQRTEPLWPIN